jgi:hypothetical protein
VARSTLPDLRAWLASRRGNTEVERAALEELIALRPGDDAAWERLADLAAQAGERDRVAELRRRKAAIDTEWDHYRQLINLPDMPPHAAEFARSAEQIGRWFDAEAWWGLAVRRDPALAGEASAAIVRLNKVESTLAPPAGRNLAELIGPSRRSLPADAPEGPGLAIPRFVDDADLRGLKFAFENGRTDLRQLPETMSGGAALLDFDGDGWLDVYTLQGGPFPPSEGESPFGDRLFRNRGDGRFEDVTTSSGLRGLAGGYGLGVAVGDYDNDGRPDILLTRWRSYSLYHNLGMGRFGDVTVEAGLGGDRGDCYRGLAADAGYRLREGDAVPTRLPGFGPSRNG